MTAKWEDLISITQENEAHQQRIIASHGAALDKTDLLGLRLEMAIDEALGEAIAQNQKRVKFELKFQERVAGVLDQLEEFVKNRQQQQRVARPQKPGLIVPGKP